MFKVKVNHLLVLLIVLFAMIFTLSACFGLEKNEMKFNGIVIAKLQEDHKSSTDYLLVLQNESGRKSFNVKPEDYAVYEKGNHAVFTYIENKDHFFSVGTIGSGFCIIFIIIMLIFIEQEDYELVWDFRK